jgi:O-succinylbenzoate synthase
MTLPALGDLLDGMRVVTLPLRIRFRGVDHREAVLLHGPAGWGEFGPFLEYDTAESSRWLAAAIEASWEGWPAPRRDRVAVNATLPAVPPDQVAGVLARYDGCGTVKVKVAEPGQSLADDESVDARWVRVDELPRMSPGQLRRIELARANQPEAVFAT